MKTADAVEKRIAEVIAMLPQQGRVEQIGPGSLLGVDLGGTWLLLPRLKSYTAPALGDYVIVSTTVSGSKIVMGAIQP